MLERTSCVLAKSDAGPPGVKFVGSSNRNEITSSIFQFTTVSGAKRWNFEFPGVIHHDPIPMGDTPERTFLSSVIGGYAHKTGKQVETLERQAELAFQNLHVPVAQPGSNSDSVAHLTILLRDYRAQSIVIKRLPQTVADEDKRPVRHAMALGLPGRKLIQLDAAGFIQRT